MELSNLGKKFVYTSIIMMFLSMVLPWDSLSDYTYLESMGLLMNIIPAVIFAISALLVILKPFVSALSRFGANYILLLLCLLNGSLFFLFIKPSYSHDPKNCDVLENYDFSQFDNWKIQVIENAPQYNLDKNFVKTLVQNYQVNKRVIENDKCQPEFTLTFSEYIDKRISKLRIKNGINKYNKYTCRSQKH